MLALHYACSNPNVNAEVISLLLSHYKDAVKAVDRVSFRSITSSSYNKGKESSHSLRLQE